MLKSCWVYSAPISSTEAVICCDAIPSFYPPNLIGYLRSGHTRPSIYIYLTLTLLPRPSGSVEDLDTNVVTLRFFSPECNEVVSIQ